MTEPIYLYHIYCLDDQTCGFVDKGIRFGGSVKRMDNYAVHKAYQGETSNPQSSNYIKKISAGPLESDCGKYMVGSMFLVESTKSGAESFIHNDPFYKANVWEKININRYISIPNGIKPVKVEKDGDDLTTIRMVTDA